MSCCQNLRAAKRRVVIRGKLVKPYAQLSVLVKTLLEKSHSGLANVMHFFVLFELNLHYFRPVELLLLSQVHEYNITERFYRKIRKLNVK